MFIQLINAGVFAGAVSCGFLKADLTRLSPGMVKNPEWFLYMFVLLCLAVYLLVIYYVFEIEKDINMGRYYQMECATGATYERETVRYLVSQYFDQRDKYALVYWLVTAFTAIASIFAGLWLLTSQKSSVTAVIGLYIVNWIAIILIFSYLADYDLKESRVVSKINSVNDEYKTHIARIVDFFNKYFDQAGPVTNPVFEKIARRYNNHINGTNITSALNTLIAQSPPTDFVSFIDFKKDRDLFINFINTTGTTAECGEDTSKSAVYFVGPDNGKKLCFNAGDVGKTYKRELEKSFDFLSNFNYDFYSRSLYEKTARLRNPFFLFLVIFLGYFYHLLCELLSFTQIAFAAILLITLLIVLIFILKYVGVLAR